MFFAHMESTILELCKPNRFGHHTQCSHPCIRASSLSAHGAHPL